MNVKRPTSPFTDLGFAIAAPESMHPYHVAR